MRQRVPLPRPRLLSHAGSIAALGILIHLAACDLVEPATKLRIEGSVLDAQTEAPVADARVRLRRLNRTTGGVLVTTTTNGQGHFNLGFVQERYCGDSLFYIEAQAEGYLTGAHGSRDAFHLRCTEELQRIDFALEPEG